MTTSVAALDLYGDGLVQAPARRDRARGLGLRAVTDTGDELPLPLERWLKRPDRAERRLLARLIGPVLDIGCGPGRHVAALARRGVPALGVDVAPAAIRLARGRGAQVLQRSIFDPLPLRGAWGSALLLDGNIGIGGDPEALLARVHELLAPGGRVALELEPPGTAGRALRVRLERDGSSSDWFPWALAGIDDVAELAGAAGFRVDELWTSRGRWFAELVQPEFQPRGAISSSTPS